jgi:tRNA1Val (adenine37-N6)-methyltransferase
MTKNSFKFKQFEISHSICSMKVGIDGVLIGAWADIHKTGDILDIGTGSGLIALMAAQRSISTQNILAIDIDSNSVIEANSNFKKSNWSDNLKAIQISVQDLPKSVNSKFGTIISNPPFFESGIKAKTEARTNARHVASLSFADLTKSVAVMLSEEGSFSVVLPSTEKSKFISIAENNGIYLTKICYVVPKPNIKAKRVLMKFQLSKPKVILVSSITIENNERHNYTDEYKNLTKDFYLKF